MIDCLQAIYTLPNWYGRRERRPLPMSHSALHSIATTAYIGWIRRCRRDNTMGSTRCETNPSAPPHSPHPSYGNMNRRIHRPYPICIVQVIPTDRYGEDGLSRFTAYPVTCSDAPYH